MEKSKYIDIYNSLPMFSRCDITHLVALNYWEKPTSHTEQNVVVGKLSLPSSGFNYLWIISPKGNNSGTTNGFNLGNYRLVSDSQIEKLTFLSELNLSEALYSRKVEKYLDLSTWGNQFSPTKYNISQALYKESTKVVLNGLGLIDFYPIFMEGKPQTGDCGIIFGKGQQNIVWRYPDYIQSLLILKLLRSIEDRLSDKSYLICSGQLYVPEYGGKPFPNSAVLIGNTLPSIPEILNHLAYYSKGLHQTIHRGYEHSTNYSDKSSRNHYLHYITLDGMHEFYKTDYFKSLKLFDVNQ